MLTLSQYRQMIDPVDTNTSELRISVNAFSPLVQLAKPRRETFQEFCYREQKQRPSYAVMDYLKEYNASRAGVAMGNQIKNFLLKNLHNRHHKDFYMGGIVQAYLDVCLAVSVADYCLKDISNEFDYSQYLKASTDSIEFCFKNITPFQTLAELPVLDGFQNVLTGMLDMAKDTEESKKTAMNRVNSSFKILKLWFEGKINYDSEYDSLLEQIEGKVADSNSLDILPYLLTVQRNKIEFIAEEIEQADMMMRSLVTENALNIFKNNLPAETPTVTETRKFLLQNKSKNNSLDLLG